MWELWKYFHRQEYVLEQELELQLLFRMYFWRDGSLSEV